MRKRENGGTGSRPHEVMGVLATNSAQEHSGNPGNQHCSKLGRKCTGTVSLECERRKEERKAFMGGQTEPQNAANSFIFVTPKIPIFPVPQSARILLHTSCSLRSGTPSYSHPPPPLCLLLPGEPRHSVLNTQRPPSNPLRPLPLRPSAVDRKPLLIQPPLSGLPKTHP